MARKFVDSATTGKGALIGKISRTRGSKYYEDFQNTNT